MRGGSRKIPKEKKVYLCGWKVCRFVVKFEQVVYTGAKVRLQGVCLWSVGLRGVCAAFVSNLFGAL